MSSLTLLMAVSYTHLAHARHGLQLLDGKRSVLSGADHAGVLRRGDEGAGQAAHRRRRHDAALLHGVVQHGERRRGAGASALTLSLIHI